MDGISMKVGCCGFPVGMAKYFQTFEAVEVNSTFYKYLDPKLVEKWRRTAPDSFEFTVKAHQDISHNFRLQPSEQCLDAFRRMRQICSTLRSRVLLIQTPGSFVPTEENLGTAADFFRSVDRGDLALAWETRGEAWNSPTTRKRLHSLLKEAEVSHVTDPLLFEPAHSTARLAYLRLHGLGERMYYYQFTDDELAQILAKTREIGGNSETTYLFFNNLSMFEDATRLAEYQREGRFRPLFKTPGRESILEVIGKTRYPISRSNLIKYFGWRLVETERGRQIRLSQALSRLSKTSYGNPDEIIKELSGA